MRVSPKKDTRSPQDHRIDNRQDDKPRVPGWSLPWSEPTDQPFRVVTPTVPGKGVSSWKDDQSDNPSGSDRLVQTEKNKPSPKYGSQVPNNSAPNEPSTHDSLGSFVQRRLLRRHAVGEPIVAVAPKRPGRTQQGAPGAFERRAGGLDEVHLVPQEHFNTRAAHSRPAPSEPPVSCAILWTTYGQGYSRFATDFSLGAAGPV